MTNDKKHLPAVSPARDDEEAVFARIRAAAAALVPPPFVLLQACLFERMEERREAITRCVARKETIRRETFLAAAQLMTLGQHLEAMSRSDPDAPKLTVLGEV